MLIGSEGFGGKIKKSLSKAWKDLKLGSIYRFLKYHLGTSIIDEEINNAIKLRVKDVRRNLYVNEKCCFVPVDYRNFVLDKEKERAIYGRKEYRLQKVVDVHENGVFSGDQFKTDKGDFLYEVVGFKIKGQANVRAVLWVKNGLLSEQNRVDRGKLVQTSFSGDISIPFTFQSVNPRTKETNFFATILLFPLSLAGRLVQYVGFRVPNLAFKLLSYAFKTVLYAAVFIASTPFLMFKRVREFDKALFLHLIGRNKVTFDHVKSCEVAKGDGVLETSVDLKDPLMVVLLINVFSSVLTVIRNSIVYSLNILACLVQAFVNLCNSVIYGDDGYRDIARFQVKSSIELFKEKVVDEVKNSLLKESRDFSELRLMYKKNHVNFSGSNGMELNEGKKLAFDESRKLRSRLEFSDGKDDIPKIDGKKSMLGFGMSKGDVVSSAVRLGEGDGLEGKKYRSRTELFSHIVKGDEFQELRGKLKSVKFGGGTVSHYMGVKSDPLPALGSSKGVSFHPHAA